LKQFLMSLDFAGSIKNGTRGREKLLAICAADLSTSKLVQDDERGKIHRKGGGW